MKTIVCVVVYNRLDNIKRWIECWQQSETNNAELRIIHNYYGDQVLKDTFETLCKTFDITYIPRNAGGFDIGALQDVCFERLEGFDNNWDAMLWCCDDTMPMSKNFIEPFTNKLPDAKIVCMQLSREVRLHVRTTGFMIAKDFSRQIQFPCDPVTTKQDCYLFEHRSQNTLYTQALKYGKVLQVSPDAVSPLWDKGYTRRLQRANEQVKAFPPGDKIVFICPVFDAYPEIISSLICQTHTNWQLLLICDNPDHDAIEKTVKAVNDPRVVYIHKERVAKWGHPLRQWALNELKENALIKDAAYVVITNADNYHVPSFCEKMLAGFYKDSKAVATYCTQMVHNYVDWRVMQCSLKKGFIDCAGVMVKKEAACEVGWNDVDSHSADWFYFNDIIKKYGLPSFKPVPGCLLIHN